MENSAVKFKCLAKGVNKTTKQEFTFDDYDNCLIKKKVTYKAMLSLIHKNHKIFLSQLIKIGLSPYDDKRYICDNGIDTLPYGIESLYFT